MNTASRRIKGKRGASPHGEKFASTEETGSYLWTAVIVSIALHAAVFGIIWVLPARKAPTALQIFNVTVTTLPGPAGGGGKSHEQVKNPVKKEKPVVPEKEPVKLAKKEVEKKPPEQKKKPEPEKPEVAKIQPRAPEGPGQGPAGGGGKAKPGAITGPVAFQGNFDQRYEWYANLIQHAVERNWSPPVSWGIRPTPAIISFVIDGGGNITDVRVEKSSGYDIYDQKALLAVKLVRRLQPPPAGLGDALGVHYSFIPGEKG
jgi:TonB family protein